MDKMSDKADQLIKTALEHRANARREIREYTISILTPHWYDSLSALIEKAVKRGYTGVEWIDFLSAGALDTEEVIRWAYKVIKQQGLSNVIEPYFNNSTRRLGIMINRVKVKEHHLLSKKGQFYPLPLELREWDGTS
jgi:hypothetical protein